MNRFIEELSWLLSSYSNLDFRSLANSVSISSSERALRRHVSRNPNIHFLIGTLPIIFSDEKYFPSNEDIAEFASEALRLPISRWEKRSRYELIGLIVCETAKLNDKRLFHLVGALSKIVSEDTGAQFLVRERKAQKLSWNDIIQRLSLAQNE